MDDYHLLNLGLVEASDLIHGGKITPLELVEATLARIERLNPTLNVYIHVMGDHALQQARYATDAIRRGEDWGPLHGIPIAVKDLIDVAGEPTTAGSDFMRGNVAKDDADVTQRLSAKGAIIVGKTNLHEFALGVTNVNPHFGAARNPWNPQTSPGGSSGGSGAAVAALMCTAALGTDTGGSVRIPAAVCGLTGIRPGKVRISTRGVIPLSITLDTVGPLARSAQDAALLVDVLDSQPLSPAGCISHLNDPVAGLRIGVPDDPYFWLESDLEVVGAVRAALDKLSDLGMLQVTCALPLVEAALHASQVIAITEAAAYHKERLAAEPGRFGADVRARLESATKYTGIDYAQARQTGREWRQSLRDLFHEQIDVIAVPATSVPAMKIEGLDSLTAGRRMLKFNYPFSLSAMPALSLPVGFTQDGLPVGMQLVAPRESTLVRVAHAYQQVTDWHRRRPEL